MIHLRTKFAAWTAIAALGAASLFAAETAADGGVHRHGHRGAFLSSYLNLTPAQQTQAKSIFEDARQQASPVRQQLKQTRASLRAAIQANHTAEIQQLATTEGGQVGQLAAIHGAAMAKVYQTLTPDQQQKLQSLREARQSRHAARHHQAAPPASQNQ